MKRTIVNQKIVNSKMLNRILFKILPDDQLEIHLQKGLQVITGRNWAGKSIILGALRLIMGEKSRFEKFCRFRIKEY